MPGYRGEGGAVGSLSLRNVSGRCIFELPSFHALFDLQFNCAPTEVNYVQLFLAGRRFFFGLGGRGGETWLRRGTSCDSKAFSEMV